MCNYVNIIMVVVCILSWYRKNVVRQAKSPKSRFLTLWDGPDLGGAKSGPICRILSQKKRANFVPTGRIIKYPTKCTLFCPVLCAPCSTLISYGRGRNSPDFAPRFRKVKNPDFPNSGIPPPPDLGQIWPPQTS